MFLSRVTRAGGVSPGHEKYATLKIQVNYISQTGLNFGVDLRVTYIRIRPVSQQKCGFTSTYSDLVQSFSTLSKYAVIGNI